MNVAAHQEKENNGKTSMGKAGQDRRPPNFKEAVSCPSAVVEGAA